MMVLWLVMKRYLVWIAANNRIGFKDNAETLQPLIASWIVFLRDGCNLRVIEISSVMLL